jgi:hypothetical protein
MNSCQSNVSNHELNRRAHIPFSAKAEDILGLEVPVAAMRTIPIPVQLLDCPGKTCQLSDHPINVSVVGPRDVFSPKCPKVPSRSPRKHEEAVAALGVLSYGLDEMICIELSG